MRIKSCNVFKMVAAFVGSIVNLQDAADVFKVSPYRDEGRLQLLISPRHEQTRRHWPILAIVLTPREGEGRVITERRPGSPPPRRPARARAALTRFPRSVAAAAHHFNVSSS